MASMLPSQSRRRAAEAFIDYSLTRRATTRHSPIRNFAICARCQSKLGKKPVSIPPGVTMQILPPVPIKSRKIAIGAEALKAEQRAKMSTVNIKGPLGEMNYAIPPYVTIVQENPQSPALVTIEDPEAKDQRAMWGTVRAYIQNHILGVSEGHTAILRLVGVGYRASVEATATTKSPVYEGQKFVNLKVGYSHPIELAIPQGVTASTPQPTRILLEGADKEVVMEFAANIRAWRRPEPYKGKGIFVNGETIKLKNKKIK